jgi:hypothetical protein
MDEWLSRGLKQFPELQDEINRNQNGTLGLWVVLYGALANAYEGRPVNDELIGRIYDYAAWCFQQSDTGDIQSDLSNATAVGHGKHSSRPSDC